MLANAVGGFCDGGAGEVWAAAGVEDEHKPMIAMMAAARILMRNLLSNLGAMRVFA